MARKYHQGVFQPKNPKKYKGNIHNIYYRSSWEFKVMKFLDENPNILYWNSEEVVVPYYSAIDGKMHRYFVDMVFQKIGKDGKKSIHLIEIKPYAQTQPPVKKKGKREDRYLNEILTFEKNQAKWAAARDYCKKRNWSFTIITEKHLGRMLGI